jgi:hypothetical protein
MSDELQQQPASMDRREMLKRSAVVGGMGAMMWAAPTVTAFGPRAFGATGSPLSGFSYVAALVTCSGTVTGSYKVKYEVDEGAWEGDPGALPGCDGTYSAAWKAAWDSATGVKGDAPPLNITVSQSGNLLTLTLNAEAGSGCTFEFNGGVNGVVKEAQSNCATGSVGADGTTLTFDLSEVAN